MKRRALAILALAIAVTAAQAHAEPSAADRALAGEEFRRGVQAFYRGAFNDAILVFEKALSYIPGEPLILDWLGKAYYRSGIEGAALQQWQFAADAGYGSALLRSRIEVVRERRSIRPDFDEASRFVEAGQIPSRSGKTILFRQPSSVLALPDGSFWVAAYGSNEIVRFDVNGVILSRARGPIGGLDRPLDLVAMGDGRMLVTEVAADRLTVLGADGSFVRSFGKKGRGNGELVGPQYAALDAAGNVYVTDYGNARVVVFDPEGAPLFSFGAKSAGFPGFTAPSGIAFIEDRLYVADSVKGSLHVFDTAGNYVETLLPEGTMPGSESIRVWNGYLLVACGNRVCMVDPHTGALFDAARLGNAPIRVTSAVPDANGNLILADYKGQTVQILSRMGELAGGMFVQIERVNAEKFPKVLVEVRVEDRGRNPIVGLRAQNFHVTEEQRPVVGLALEGSAFLNDACDVTVLVDRSPESARYVAEINAAITEINAAMGGKGTLRIVSAGSVPVSEGAGPAGDRVFERAKLKSPISPDWAFDLGLRLAVNDLVNAEKRRAVVFLSAGRMPETAFRRYGLNDLAAYLNNNGVIFSTVYLGRSASLGELDYLARQTGGESCYLYRNEGIAPLVERARKAPNGSYLLSYTSVLPTDFGRAYLPVEVEAYVMKRSGRDETGYFAPLE